MNEQQKKISDNRAAIDAAIARFGELDDYYIMDEVTVYFANGKGERYRSIGCYPCTFPIKSNAKTVREIIEELRVTKTSERAGRAQDKESEDAFEKLRRDGYM